MSQFNHVTIVLDQSLNVTKQDYFAYHFKNKYGWINLLEYLNNRIVIKYLHNEVLCDSNIQIALYVGQNLSVSN